MIDGTGENKTDLHLIKEDEVPFISVLSGYNVEELKQQWFDAGTFKKLMDDFRNT